VKVYDLKNESNILFAFETRNLGWRKAVAIIKRLDGAVIIKQPKCFRFHNEEGICEFEFQGSSFIVEETWGDSSRYWVGPKVLEECNGIDKVREHFFKQ